MKTDERKVGMRHRLPVSGLAVAAVVATVSLAQVPLAGQDPSTARKSTKVSAAPRTPWGTPDLQGVWDFRTLTPLERPNALGERQEFTEEEASARNEEFATRADRRGKRGTAGDLGTYNAFWWDWGKVPANRRTSLIIDPPDGRLPSMTPEAQKRKAAEAQARRGIDMDAPTRGGWVDDLGAGGFRLRCLVGFNSGPPITPSAYNNNVQLFQTRDHVAILTEMIHDARIVPLDGRAHGNLRLWAGDSRGRWEGDTLVVDSVNFRAATIPYDWFTIGSPYENVQKTHLVERFTRVDAETLLYEFTVENPSVWTRPWTAQVQMTKSQLPLYEYACHEGNYSLGAVLAGARAKEQAEESAPKGRR